MLQIVSSVALMVSIGLHLFSPRPSRIRWPTSAPPPPEAWAPAKRTPAKEMSPDAAVRIPRT